MLNVQFKENERKTDRKKEAKGRGGRRNWNVEDSTCSNFFVIFRGTRSVALSKSLCPLRSLEGGDGKDGDGGNRVVRM